MDICDANYIEILTDRIKHLEGDIKALLKDNTSLREEIIDLKYKSNGDDKLLKAFARNCNVLNRENEELRGELEIAIKGQEEYVTYSKYLESKIDVLEDRLSPPIEIESEI